MRTILIIILVAVVLGLVGWLSFSNPDGNPTLRVNTDKIKQDTSTVIEKTKDLANDSIDQVDFDGTTREPAE